MEPHIGTKKKAEESATVLNLPVLSQTWNDEQLRAELHQAVEDLLHNGKRVGVLYQSRIKGGRFIEQRNAEGTPCLRLFLGRGTFRSLLTSAQSQFPGMQEKKENQHAG